MGGRFFLLLAMIALAAFAASLVWAGAIVAGRAQYGSLWQFPAFFLPLAISMFAIAPRTEGERLLLAAPFGLTRSNRRAALVSCFAPYRPRESAIGGIGKGPNARITGATFALGALTLASGLIIPVACFGAFALALRRAAWCGNGDAILLEWDWLRVRGPVRVGAGGRLAARTRAR